MGRLRLTWTARRYAAAMNLKSLVETYSVEPGQVLYAEGLVCAAPDTNGFAYIALRLIHPSGDQTRDVWLKSMALDGVRVSADAPDQPMLVQRELVIPDWCHTAELYAETSGHTRGYWRWNEVRAGKPMHAALT